MWSTSIDLTVTVKNGFFEHVANGAVAFFSSEKI